MARREEGPQGTVVPEHRFAEDFRSPFSIQEAIVIGIEHEAVLFEMDIGFGQDFLKLLTQDRFAGTGGPIQDNQLFFAHIFVFSSTVLQSASIAHTVLLL